MKARRIEDSKNYVILEEIEHNPLDDKNHPQGHHHHHHTFSTKLTQASRISRKRILADEEILYVVQSNWKSKGLFRLLPRIEASVIVEKDSRPKVLLRWTQTAKGSFRKISRMSSYTKSKESSTDRDSTSPGKSDSYESGENSSRGSSLGGTLGQFRDVLASGSPIKKFFHVSSLPERSVYSVDESKVFGVRVGRKSSPSSLKGSRDVHSEGETSAALPVEENEEEEENDDDESSSTSTFSRLRKLSFKSWKVWR